MSTRTPNPEPRPEDLDSTVEEIVRFVAEQAPAVAPAPTPSADTRRVRELRAEVAEAHVLLDLQGDAAPLLVDTDRVRRSRKRAAEAARLHALAQDPAARAWQAARVRLVLTAVALTALVGALAWSTTGAHATLTRDMAERGAAWWGAWLVEPVVSAVLLVVVGAKAFLAARGRVLRHRHLTVVEAVALAVTLVLNTWHHLPWVAARFEPMQLLAHAVGPLVAVGAVTVLPVIWTAFAELDHGLPAGPTAGLTEGLTPAKYSGNATASAPAGDGLTGRLAARARDLIAAGELPADPSANRLRTALGCGMDTAREVRDALRGGAA
ncbi:hypothetical protein [Saccharothrix sp. NRRL B-16314]|uniref:hypothetical protein n=1 Tax=Saccharothrix sp. NRRL B-16314 TaxID=1463825 RepID=UPI0006901F9E|nr:hypothetical protein [Saccharothrix sp. NRRL B-16314]